MRWLLSPPSVGGGAGPVNNSPSCVYSGAKWRVRWDKKTRWWLQLYWSVHVTFSGCVSCSGSGSDSHRRPGFQSCPGSLGDGSGRWVYCWLKASFALCHWKTAIVDFLVGFSFTLRCQSGFFKESIHTSGLGSYKQPCSVFGLDVFNHWCIERFLFFPGVSLRAVFSSCLVDKSKKARTCCLCAAGASQKEMVDSHCAAASRFFFLYRLQQ